jgi:preprotein translocase subunit SecD
VKTWLLILGGLAALGLLALTGVAVYRLSDRPAFLDKPPLHGTAFIIETALPENPGGTNVLPQLKQVIGSRASGAGLWVFWEPLSETRVRVSVQFKEHMDAPTLRSALFRGGALELRLVHEQSDELVRDNIIPPGYEVLERELVSSRPQLPRGAVLLRDPSAIPTEKLVVKKKPEAGMAGKVVRQAMVLRDSSGRPEISFTLRAEAATAFAKITRENVGRRLAVVTDGELMTAPVIRSAIEGGTAVVEGDYTVREALDLANALECPMPVPVKVVEAKDF